jgi:hypothetical protein
MFLTFPKDELAIKVSIASFATEVSLIAIISVFAARESVRDITRTPRVERASRSLPLLMFVQKTTRADRQLCIEIIRKKQLWARLRSC